MRPTDPTTVGGFTLTGRLGEGAQGAVFLGVSGAGEKVAVKLLHPWVMHNPTALRHLRRELAAVERVAPFCTARILASDATGDLPYIVSEYVDGPSLQQVISEGRTFAEADLAQLAIGTATALAAIHEAGVVHRDFKPGNVLLGSDGPRVIDFGIARPLDATAATMSGAIGTPSYMAPEQLAGAPAGPPLDLFAWGCTIAAAANGLPPFGGESIPAVITRIVHSPPDLGGLTGDLRELVSACLDKDPERRPTALQVLSRLLGDARQRDLLESGTTTAARLRAPLQQRLPSPGPPPGSPQNAPPGPPPGFPSGPPPGSPSGLPTEPPSPYPQRWAAGPPYPAPGPRQRSGAGRAGAIAGGIAAAVLVIGATTAFVLNGVLNDGDRSGTGGERAGSSPSPAPTGPCSYLPPASDAQSVQRNSGTPPPRPEITGTVRATLTTDRGVIVMDLDAAKAPCTVNSFTYLAQRAYFDSTQCHRLSTVRELRVLQCGDPSGTGTGGPAYRFGDENPAGTSYVRGTVAMANTAQPDTNGSQFFIVYGDIPRLEGNYTVFGKVVSGLQVVDDVARHGTDDSEARGAGHPKQKITIQRVTLTPRS
ncbi:protein kinase domain-containing protein [Actinomadura sp. HBU206391]|uniref:protein kinase domain-containing protein n=1 Tax=Actinomadura sp. HBU206391 TaxID=2731692 RepID=UPI0016504F7F|nr:peptidylprolyl isomerase [Actinomadura sp. HBU206391]MBC6457302.1 peptidylprolyl isomerase [Actinomadura sp. HBU206391]